MERRSYMYYTRTHRSKPHRTNVRLEIFHLCFQLQHVEQILVQQHAPWSNPNFRKVDYTTHRS